MDKKTTRRGNYESGSDYVLEYGELRFTFNERDFRERCEQAARKVGFIEDEIEPDEAEDDAHRKRPESGAAAGVATGLALTYGPTGSRN